MINYTVLLLIFKSFETIYHRYIMIKSLRRNNNCDMIKILSVVYVHPCKDCVKLSSNADISEFLDFFLSCFSLFETISITLASSRNTE